MSSRAPSSTEVVWMVARYSGPSAARMSSPQRRSTSSPATAATSWSPPIPMWRWIRVIGSTTPCWRNAMYQDIACW